MAFQNCESGQCTIFMHIERNISRKDNMEESGDFLGGKVFGTLAYACYSEEVLGHFFPAYAPKILTELISSVSESLTLK